MFDLIRLAAFNTFQSLSSVYKSDMSPFPAVLALGDTWIYICAMNGSNIAPNVETLINKTFSLTITLNISYVQLNNSYI